MVKKKRKMSPEQREAAAERLRLAREKKGPAQYKNVAKSVLALPDDHYLSYKSVKRWIKTQQEIARAERKNMVKGVKGAASKGAEVVGDTAHSLAGMIEKAKEGITMEMQAKNSPDAFLATYQALQGKLNDMGVPAGTPEEAEASLGIWEAPEGQEALKVGAEKAGITPAELKSLTALYVTQSKYVDMASKARGAMAEGTITRSQLQSLIRETLKGN